MAKKIRLGARVVTLVILFLALYGCSPEDTDTAVNDVKCWVSLEGSEMGDASLRVRLENGDGDIPTGARVLLETPNREIQWVPFSSDLFLYTSAISNLVDGTYTVHAESADESLEIPVPMIVLENKPEVSIMEDSTGIVAGLGKNMKAGNAITMQWESVNGATVYKGTVYTGAEAVYVFSTDKATWIIPKDTLRGGSSYGVILEAQYISGDPYLRENNYYAFHCTESAKYLFTLD